MCVVLETEPLQFRTDLIYGKHVALQTVGYVNNPNKGFLVVR